MLKFVCSESRVDIEEQAEVRASHAEEPHEGLTSLGAFPVTGRASWNSPFYALVGEERHCHGHFTEDLRHAWLNVQISKQADVSWKKWSLTQWWKSKL